MFGNPALMCVFGNVVTLLIMVMGIAIFVYTQIINKCTYFLGFPDGQDAIGPAVGRMINANDFCFVNKKLISSGGGLLISMIFIYLITAVGIATRNRYVQAVNLVACVPLEFLFGVLCFYIGAAANNRDWAKRGNAATIIIGVVMGIMNVITPGLVYTMLIMKRRDVILLESDVEEEASDRAQRFELQVQTYQDQFSRQRQQSGSGAGRGAGGGRGGAGRGRGGGRGGGAAAGPAGKPAGKKTAAGAAAPGGKNAAASTSNLAVSKENFQSQAMDTEQGGAASGGAGSKTNSQQFMTWGDAAKEQEKSPRNSSPNMSPAAKSGGDSAYNPPESVLPDA